MPSEDVESLRRRIKALILFRAIFTTLLIGSSYFLSGLQGFTSVFLLSRLIISIYILTIIYSLLLSRIKNLVIFGYIQLILDVMLAGVLIAITGGIESWFSFSLILVVISSSIVLDKKAGYFIATLSSFLYLAIAINQFYNFVPSLGYSSGEEKNYLYKVYVHIISFYLTAYLSGYLSSRLEKTVRKLEEKDFDLRDLEFFNKEVIDNMHSGLITTDISGKVLLFNRAAEKITGVKREVIIGQKIDSFLPFFPFPFPEGRKEDTIIVEGVQKIIGLGVSTLKGVDERIKGYIIIFQDLTDKKRLEAEMKRKEKWAAIGELSSNIAHEIRNPLASLKSSIEMLREDLIPKDYKDKLMRIALNEMDRLNRIISDFLTYSRPTNPEMKKVDIHEILNETVELLKNVEQNMNNVTIEKIYSGSLQVNIDPQKMKQVFWNLGLNALEAMPSGGKLIISTEHSNGFVHIHFKDSGVGIEEMNIEKIFYPFFTTKEQGTGLGLAIAYRIIEEHRGSIKVESSTDIGTNFEIIIPDTYEKV